MSCSFCGENRFGNGAQLQCHVSKNHAQYSCNCNKKFVEENDLLNHLRSKELNQKDCPCSGCCRSFVNEKDLWNHKSSVNHWESGERSAMKEKLGIHPCDDRCGRTFKSEQALKDHIKDKAGRFSDKEKTCGACAVPFGTPEKLAQHKKDTGHSGKASRKEHIDILYKRNVAVSKHDKKDSVEKVDKVIRGIMDNVKHADGGQIYDQNVRKAGSYPIKMKIGKADEFDTQVYLNTKPAEMVTKGKTTYKYNTIDPKEGTDNNMKITRTRVDDPKGVTIPNGYAVLKTTDETVPSHLVHNGELVPRAVKEDLHRKIGHAVKDMNGVYLNKYSHGPALTLTIVPEVGGHHISVDITPTVPCTEPATISRPDFVKAYDAETRARVQTAGYCFVPKQNEVWLKSNNSMAQELLSKIDEGNGCRRYVTKILKKEFMTCASRSPDGLPGVSSHILKHHLLWRSEQEGLKDRNYWRMDNVDNCLIDTMKDLEHCLCRGKLPDYFNTSVNILHGKDRGVLRSLADHLKSRRIELMHM